MEFRSPWDHMETNVRLSGLRLVVLSAMMAVAAIAAPGDLDTSFGGTGRRCIGFAGGYDQAYAATVQPDGKLIMAGTSKDGPLKFSLVRFDTNNLPDLTFGDGGMVVTPVSLVVGLSNSAGRVAAVKVQADGKIVAAGEAYTSLTHIDFVVVRYNPDGALDTTFGTNGTGKVYTALPSRGGMIRAMQIQEDGKIVVAGHTISLSGAGEGTLVVARYQTNGVLDGTFGVGGMQTAMVFFGNTGAHSLLLQPDGKILAGGIGLGAGHSGVDFGLYRFTTNGVPDSGFGGGTGMVFTRISTNDATYFDSIEAMAWQTGDSTVENPDKIVVAGSHRNGAGLTTLAMARYKLNGDLDSSFGNGGVVTNSIASSAFDLCTGKGLTVQGLGTQPRKIVVGGYASDAGKVAAVIAGYNSDGSFDTTFGTNGVGIVPFPTNEDARVSCLVVQSEKYVIGGYSGVSSNGDYDFKALRFDPAGTLDTNFGVGGVLTADLIDVEAKALGVVAQADGKVVAAGTSKRGNMDVFALARFNIDGSLDSSFGFRGKVTTKLGLGGIANAVVVQPDGKIVAVGSASDETNSNFAIVRYNTNGTLDASFGTNGVMITPIGDASSYALAVALQADGKYVVAGGAYSGGNNHFAVVRYTTNGLPDVTFDGDGIARIPAVANAAYYAEAVKMQPDGKIVVGGAVVIDQVTWDFLLARFDTNGRLDNSFGSSGLVQTDIGGATYDIIYGLAIQPDNKIVAAGDSWDPKNHVCLVRYNSNGTLDSTFSGDGKAIWSSNVWISHVSAVTLQSDGKILAGASGMATNETASAFMALRCDTDGSFDTSYGMEGVAMVDFPNDNSDAPYAIAMDPLGRLVMAGSAGTSLGIVRLQGEPFLKILSINRSGNGSRKLVGMGVPGKSHTLKASASLNFSSPSALGPVTADASGLWEFEDATVLGATNRFYWLSLP